MNGIRIQTAYGYIEVENTDTLNALVCALHDARDWNDTHDYEACAAENYSWIRMLRIARDETR